MRVDGFHIPPLGPPILRNSSELTSPLPVPILEIFRSSCYDFQKLGYVGTRDTNENGWGVYSLGNCEILKL